MLASFFKKKDRPKKEKPPLTPKRMTREVTSITIFVVIIFAARSSFFEPFRIPTGSMIPTLMIGDFIWVNKAAYGLKVPFSEMYSDPIYLFKRKGPQRGDVVVFKYPRNENINFIKRVVGVPGDHIEIHGRTLYINGKSGANHPCVSG